MLHPWVAGSGLKSAANARASGVPTAAELNHAHQVYAEHEPRDIFYRVATELIDLALRNATTITASEALVVLLQTWNARYYVSQYHGNFPHEHLDRLEKLL